MVKWLLRRCAECGKYTLNKIQCPTCGGKVRIPHPAKFSPNDRYIQYRTHKKIDEENSPSLKET